jgi:hypothetical protein
MVSMNYLIMRVCLLNSSLNFNVTLEFDNTKSENTHNNIKTIFFDTNKVNGFNCILRNECESNNRSITQVNIDDINESATQFTNLLHSGLLKAGLKINLKRKLS